MYRDLIIQFNHSQREYERELKQLNWLGRLRREQREARDAKREAVQARHAQPKGVTA